MVVQWLVVANIVHPLLADFQTFRLHGFVLCFGFHSFVESASLLIIVTCNCSFSFAVTRLIRAELDHGDPQEPKPDGHEAEEPGHPLAAEQALDLGPEVPEQGDRDDVEDPHAVGVGDRPGDDPPDLALHERVGVEHQRGLDRLARRLDGPHDERDDRHHDHQHRGGDVDAAEPEPAVVGPASGSCHPPSVAHGATLAG